MNESQRELQGFPVVLHTDDIPSWRWYTYDSIMFRTGRQRQTEIPDDRRHQRVSHDQRWIRHFVMPRSRVPCPDSQVSRNSRRFADFIVASHNCPLLPRASTTGRARSECTSKTFEYHQLDWTRDEEQREHAAFLSWPGIPSPVL